MCCKEVQPGYLEFETLQVPINPDLRLPVYNGEPCNAGKARVKLSEGLLRSINNFGGDRNIAKKDAATFAMNRLRYNQDRDELELGGKPVSNGRPLELCVMGYWLSGVVHRDGSGWYLLTRDQIGIRLVTGLRARIPDISLTITAFRGREPQREVRDPAV